MFLGTTVYSIQDIHHCIHTTDNGVVLIHQTCQLGLQYFFHFLDDIRTGTIHDCNTSGYLCLAVGWQCGNDQRRLAG